MSTALLRLCLTVSLAMPAAHRLSVVMGVGGWGCPSSMRMVRMTSASRALKKRPPSSASAADASTFLINVQRMCIAPLRGGGEEVGDGGEFGLSDRDDRKKYPPARDRAPFSDR